MTTTNATCVEEARPDRLEHPILEVLEGGVAPDVASWEARAQVEMATLIEVYLSQRPSPGPSRHRDLYERWAQELREAGEGRLASQGDRRLQAVGSPTP